MNKNKKIVWTVVGVIVLVGVFFGGVAYGKSKTPARGTGAAAFAGRGGTFAVGGARTAGAGFTTGQIISKDATSITVSLASGGSKIIFLDSSTPISKEASGTMSDLAVGTQVSVTGAANSDGSINATMVQIRPKMAASATTTPVVQ